MSFNVTIRPKLFGVYESTRARLRYIATVPMDGLDPEYKQGLSTSLGRVRIISKVEHARNWQFFTLHWIVFALAYAVPTIFPLVYWQQSIAKTQYLVGQTTNSNSHGFYGGNSKKRIGKAE
jgi:predicted metal-binding membrane protein